MSWFKLDDQMPDHPKVLAVGGDAAWLWVCGGCYCARHLTDGKIPKAAVGRLTDRTRPDRLAQLLVGADLWHDRGDHFEHHDYLVYNPSRESVMEERRKAAERRARGGQSSAAGRATGDGASGDGRATGAQRAGAPDPTRPGVTPAPSVRPPRDRGTRIPDSFEVTPSMIEWAELECPSVDWRFESRRFVDWAKSASGRNAVKRDWSRAWRNWIRNEFKGARRG